MRWTVFSNLWSSNLVYKKRTTSSSVTWAFKHSKQNSRPHISFCVHICLLQVKPISILTKFEISFSVLLQINVETSKALSNLAGTDRFQRVRHITGIRCSAYNMSCFITECSINMLVSVHKASIIASVILSLLTVLSTAPLQCSDQYFTNSAKFKIGCLVSVYISPRTTLPVLHPFAASNFFSYKTT